MKNVVKYKEELVKRLARDQQRYEAKINQKMPDTDSNADDESGMID